MISLPTANLLPESDAGHEPVDTVSIARLYGEPLFNLPTDLYIPPEALEVFLEAFSGPLDLLLYLIRRQNFNILDIPMAQVTAQYLGYVEQIRSRNLELAAEYLLMAAMLIEIKTHMLLPAPPAIEGEEVADPRAQLVQRLLIYEQAKKAAQELALLPQHGYDFLSAKVFHDWTQPVVLPTIAAADLWQVWQQLMRKAQLQSHHKISRDPLSVRDYMSRILKKLQGFRSTPLPATFRELFQKNDSIAEVVVSFIAILELARERLIFIDQVNSDIYLRLPADFSPLEQLEH